MRRIRFIPSLDALPSRIAPSATPAPTDARGDMPSTTGAEFSGMSVEDEECGDMPSEPIGYDPLAPQSPSDWMG